mmetsp:Transcript_129777/g.276956  ORF Transcript_129777/g.276956 Transcript_129777/m.276956 type:complete len:741 (+) Transcript_129777:68-2290(+)
MKVSASAPSLGVGLSKPCTPAASKRLPPVSSPQVVLRAELFQAGLNGWSGSLRRFPSSVAPLGGSPTSSSLADSPSSRPHPDGEGLPGDHDDSAGASKAAAQRSVSPGQEDRPRLTQGTSSAMEIVNDRTSERLKSLGLDQRPKTPPDPRDMKMAHHLYNRSRMRAASKGFSADDAEAQEMTRQLDSLADRVVGIRKRHETFKPLTRAERARIQAFGGDAGKASTSSKQRSKRVGDDAGEDGLDLAERIDLWKYVRKIEMDPPPLDRSDLREEEPSHVPLMLHNLSAEALNPNRRFEHIASKKVERIAKQSEATERREKIRAEKMAKRRESAMRSAGLILVHHDTAESDALARQNALQARQELLGKWMSFSVIATVAAKLREELTLGRMSTSERMKYMQTNLERILKQNPRGTEALRMVWLQERMDDEQFRSKQALVISRWSVKLGIKNSRKHAKICRHWLSEWKVAGTMILRLRKIGRQVRRLQRWWRHCRRQLFEVRDRLSRQWISVERAALTQQISMQMGLVPATPPAAPPAEKISAIRINSNLSLEENVQRYMLDEEARILFLSHELRARRFMLLPRLHVWEDEERTRVKNKRQELEAMRAAYEAVGSEDKPSSAFSKIPHERPSYLPSDEELVEMISRAKKLKASGGWTTIPPLSPFARPATTGGRRSSRRQPKGTRNIVHRPGAEAGRSASKQGAAWLARVAEDEELRGFGVHPTTMPRHGHRPAPPTEECEEE